MADPQCSTLITKLGFGVLACNSALAIRNSWGDAGSVAFVLAADAALLLLFLCLRLFEQQGGGRAMDANKIKAAVWALTTLLTAMFAYKVAPLMPLAVGVLVFLCLGEVEQVRRGGINKAGQYSVLAKVSLAVVTCNAALDAYGARRDSSSVAFVFASFVCLVILMGFFVRAFAQARAGEQEEH